MKKTISIVLTLILMFSLSVTAFAANVNDVPATESADVNATYVAGAAGGVVFSVDIEWTAMDFTYQAAGQPVWDPESHTYSEAVPASWSGSGTVTITNHSNTALNVTPSYTMDSGFDATKLTFTADGAAVNGAVIVGSAADAGAAVQKVITVTPAGSLASGTDGKIGSVTVTIEENSDVSLETGKELLAKMNSLRYSREQTYDTMTDEEKVAYETFNQVLAVYQNELTAFEEGYTEQAEFNGDYQAALTHYNGYLASTTYEG